ncbi:MAG: hypothetical protein FD167_128 [bacterium]|nr:MAG: hypothetical protein FD167_128 [bacterium]
MKGNINKTLRIILRLVEAGLVKDDKSLLTGVILQAL